MHHHDQTQKVPWKEDNCLISIFRGEMQQQDFFGSGSGAPHPGNGGFWLKIRIMGEADQKRPSSSSE